MPRVVKYIIPSLVYFGFTFCFRMFYAYVPIHLKALGLGPPAMGTLVAVYPLCLLLVSIPIGMISDRFSPRTSAITGILLTSFSVWCMRGATNFHTLFLCFTGIGVGATLYVISAASLYFKSLGGTRRGMKLALFGALNALGYGTGPLLGGYLISKTGGMTLVLTASALMLLPCGLLMRAAEDVRVHPVSLRDYAADLTDRRAWFLLAIIFLFSLHFGVENLSQPLFLRYVCGISNFQIGVVFFLVGLALAASNVITGLLADSAQRRDGLMALGMALSGLFNACLYFTHALWPVVALKALHAAGDGIFLLYLDVSVSRLFPARRVGTPVGMRDTMKMSGMFAGTFLAAAIPGYAAPFLVVGLLSMAVAPIVYKYFRSM